MKLEYVVNNLTEYSTVKEVLKQEFLLSDRLIIKLKKNNQIYLNNKTTFVNQKLEIGDKVLVVLDFEETCDNIVPTKMDLNILYEVNFNHQVGLDACLYFTSKKGDLKKILNDEKYLKSIKTECGVKAKKRIEDEYTWKYILEKYEDLFDGE